MKLLLPLLVITTLCCAHSTCRSQDSSRPAVLPVSSRYFDHVSKQTASLRDKIDKRSKKLLRRLQQHEATLSRMLLNIDSLDTKVFFAGAQQKYEQLSNPLKQKAGGLAGTTGGEYLPYLDSLKGSLSFLDGNRTLLSAAKSGKLDNALGDVRQLEDRFQQADAIKEFIRDRKQQIQAILNRHTSLPKKISKTVGRYNSDFYYYSAAIRDYRETFRNPDKMQRTALSILNRVPAFQQFMKEHSVLGSLFNLPAGYGTAQGIAGLQTRDQVQQNITGQMGSGNVNAGQLFGQQLQAAQSGLDQFKQKLSALGGGSGDIDMPDFKPNNQRTKTFLQRLEYGTNIQSTKSGYFFPAVTDIGLSVGYKIDEKKIFGIGLSYKIGWGRDIHHIAITSRGLGLRTFADIKIKKSFYASTGFEYNYQKQINGTEQLYNLDDWQKSGLLGISKIVSIKSSVFKKTKLQLLWDFLSYSQKIRTEPLKFRVQYNF